MTLIRCERKMETDKFIFEEEDVKTTLAAILRRNSEKWLRRGTTILKNREDAEDVLSEAFRRMLKRGGRQFTSQEQMRMYMGRVVDNTAFELYKRRQRERRQYAPVSDGIVAKSATGLSFSCRPDYIMEREESYVDHEERLRILRRGLEELPVNQYEAIRLTVLGGGMTFSDMESVCGIPRTTLRYRYHQGVIALRKYMARELIVKKMTDTGRNRNGN